MIGRKHLRLIFFLLFASAAQGWAPVWAQSAPPPLRIYIPFEAAWDSMIETLGKNEFELLRQDRGQGFLLSSFREYASGLLTDSHIRKIGEEPKLIEGDWVRVRYQYEIRVALIPQGQEIVQPLVAGQDFLGYVACCDNRTGVSPAEDPRADRVIVRAVFHERCIGCMSGPRCAVGVLVLLYVDKVAVEVRDQDRKRRSVGVIPVACASIVSAAFRPV